MQQYTIRVLYTALQQIKVYYNFSLFQNGSHAASLRNGRSVSRDRHVSMQSRREDLEMRCCRINVLLVTMQLCLGVTVTSLGFYMQTLTTTLFVRECPFWAGVPVSNMRAGRWGGGADFVLCGENQCLQDLILFILYSTVVP